jgi:hypothetical protein
MNSKTIKEFIFEMDAMIATFQEYAQYGLGHQKETYTMLKDVRLRLIEESERAQSLERMRLLQEGAKNISRPVFKH